LTTDNWIAMSHTRRQFVQVAGGALLASVVAPSPAMPAQPSGGRPVRRRYAIVGTGHRATGMWGRDLAGRYDDVLEFVGLADVNPLRVEVAKSLIGVDCPTFTDVDRMLDQTRPDLLLVCTVDAAHAGYIVKGLERGIDVLTEKPMVIDEAQCRAVLDAERRTGRRLGVTFNYRYAPKHRRVKELLLEGAIGRVTSVDFAWFLDVYHGADYFRRWHRLREMGGTLFVHKATHHFDLVNWWLDADPVEVVAHGELERYGRHGAVRHTHCRPCPVKDRCEFHWDLTKDARLVRLYADCESADGYHRDGCVFREDVNIYDTMTALVRYSTGVQMSYSLNAFMPFEGYRVAFNGEHGRLEVRDFERQPWTPAEETEVELTRNFGRRERIAIPAAAGGHGGGDDVLRDLVFRNIGGPDHMRLPNSRAGALSCLTGIAARTSVEERRPVRIADLCPV
jgi:predicted dehydrogenase